jgi:predicted nucleic acid-binding protein
MIVVDASLAVKWYLSESGSDEAERLLAENLEDIVCPDLIAIEVGAALVRRANMSKAAVADMETAIDKWAKLLAEGGVKLISTVPERMRAAALIAISLGHPLKDCLYLALAIELDCDFVTCDARFAAKVVTLFPRTRELTGVPL